MFKLALGDSFPLPLSLSLFRQLIALAILDDTLAAVQLSTKFNRNWTHTNTHRLSPSGSPNDGNVIVYLRPTPRQAIPTWPCFITRLA